MTEEDRRALKGRFHATLSNDEAMDELREFGKTAPGPHKIAVAEAMLDLRSGRSMQSTMARFRRGIGVDPPK